MLKSQLFAEWGFALLKQDVVSVVDDFANPVKDGSPGKAWWLGFFRCHGLAGCSSSSILTIDTTL